MPRYRLFCIPAWLVPAIALAGIAHAALVINEVLYDPAGPDDGREFVEITNTGPYAAPLDGLALESGNGGKPNDWKEVWRGAAGSWIEPGGFYRVGLDGPGRGEPARLDLQNGPDGVRLLKQGFELDRLGWGEHTHGEYYEGHPAPLARGGQSLARRVDGTDSQDNAADFEASAPTPGRPNHPSIDWAIRFGTPEPELPRPAGALVARLTIVNRGVEPRTPPPVEIADDRRTIEVGWSSTLPPQSAETQAIVLDTPPDTGRAVWRARILAADQVPENDADSLILRIGPGMARVTEIMAAPAPGECEWIEIAVAVPDGKTLSGFRLDVRGHALNLSPRIVGPEGRLGLVVEDSTLMRARYPRLSAAAFWSYEGAWQRLRNGDRSGGVSDTIRLLGPDGLLADIALPGAAPAPGVSLERLGFDLPEGPGAWVPCGAAEHSTPGEAGPEGVSAAPEEPLAVQPRIVHPGLSACLFEGRLGSRPGEVRLEIFDLEGNSVRCLLRGIWAVGKVIASWDGRDESQRNVDPGIYIAVLEVKRGAREIERSRIGVAAAPGSAPGSAQ
jgi:hypothetical protein